MSEELHAGVAARSARSRRVAAIPAPQARALIFVRHGRSVVRRDLVPHEWPLDAAHVGEIAKLHSVLPDLPVVCSDMRRAIDTARYFGEPTIDARLAEVTRPWTDDLDDGIARYLHGEQLQGWEPQADVQARIQAVVDAHPDAIYVTHGTAMTLYLASLVPTLNTKQFWADLRMPDAWQTDGESLRRVSVPRVNRA